VTDIDRAFFHSAGKTADGTRDVYEIGFGPTSDENGRFLGYCWRCKCGRCKSVPIGPFQSREAAQEHLKRELGAVIDDIKITEVSGSGVQ
jgi:hypothetical protein